MPKDFDKLLRSIEVSKKKHPSVNKALAEALQTQRAAVGATENRIERYNDAWFSALIEYMIDEGLGWCGSDSSGHCCKEEDLQGYAHWGRHWVGSEYYEREESFHYTGVRCKDCKKRLHGLSGYKVIPLDTRAVWTEELDCYWWGDPSQGVLELAKKAGLPSRIKRSISGGVTKYTLDDEVILEVRK